METLKSKCRHCGKEVNAVAFGEMHLIPDCNECADRLAIPDIDHILENRKSTWREICPSEFRFTDINHKSWIASKDSIGKVLAWKPTKEGRGMILGGTTGKCKTRSVWKMLERFHFDGVQIEALNETDFSHKVGQKFSTSPADGSQWIESLIRVPILFLDDIGKSVSTERFRQELFHVIDKRTSWRRPIIATVNADGKKLAEKLGESGPQIVRRLRDYCDAIVF